MANIIEQCGGLGANRNDLLGCVPGGAEALLDDSKRFDETVVLDVYEKAKFLTGFEEIGLLSGNSITPGTVSILEQASSSSRTLRDAVMLNARYPGLRQDFGQLDAQDTDQGFEIRWNTTYDDPEPYRSFVEAIMSRYNIFGQTFLVRAVEQKDENALQKIFFRHKRPYYGDLYEKIFNCEVIFEAEREMLLLPQYYADAELAIHSPEILKLLFQRLDNDFASLRISQSSMLRIKAGIRKSLENGSANQQSVASLLGMSHRALRRRLSDYQISFRQMLSEERKALCDLYIGEGKPFSLIAQDLGYNDQSAFNRAFKSWHGLSPTKYRARLK